MHQRDRAKQQQDRRIEQVTEIVQSAAQASRVIENSKREIRRARELTAFATSIARACRRARVASAGFCAELSITRRALRWISESRTRAAPVGFRRPCSHCRSVPVGTPRSRAKFSCVYGIQWPGHVVFSRIAATSISSGIFAPLICLWLATLVPPSMLARCVLTCAVHRLSDHPSYGGCPVGLAGGGQEALPRQLGGYLPQ